MLLFLEENNIYMVHIYYCNDAYRRNWLRLTQILKFSGKNNLLVENPKLMASQL